MFHFRFELSLKLKSIRHFFEQNLKDIDSEILQIESNWDESQAETADDFGNLMFQPMQREKITLRATYYELNALVEHYLRSFAQEAYWKSAKHASVPKSVIDVPKGEIHRIKLVEDLPMGEIKRLIEHYYEFSLNQIPQYDAVSYIREIANSFKHRNGYNDFRRDPELRMPERYQLSRDKTRQAIADVRQFLLSVYDKVTRSDDKSGTSFEDDNGG